MIKHEADIIGGLNMTDQISNEAYEEIMKHAEDEHSELIEVLQEIREAVWDVDIPSPTVPEYIEHHKQIQSILALIDSKIKEASE